MTATKRKYRVVGVPFGKSVTDYAERLETAMNQLVEDGYVFQITEQKNGSVIVGQHRSPHEAEHGDDEPSDFSAKTQELVDRAARLTYFGEDLPEFTIEAQKQASALARGFSTEELRIAADELDAEAAAHEQRVKHAKPCLFAASLRVVAGLMRREAHISLQ